MSFFDGRFIRRLYNFLFQRFFFIRAVQPRFLNYQWCQLIYLFGQNKTNCNRVAALKEAIDWMYCSIDAGNENGSRCFSLATGWSKCYPEVTGYNLYTLFDHYHFAQCYESFDRAIKMADWELTIQLPNGSFQGGYIDQQPKPIVFNTGQVLQGIIRAYQESGEEKYLIAAKKAADWLVEVQDEDGAWRRYCYLNVPRVTDSRIAYPLAETGKISGNTQYQDAAYRSLDYVVKRQADNGWFPDCDNSIKYVDQPNTHTLVYTVEGLLYGGILLNENRFIRAAQLTADKMLRRFEIDKKLYGRYNSNWKATVKWTCLTGCAQISLVWSKLFEITNNAWYLNAALKMNDYLCKNQNIVSSVRGIRGGIPGSDPIIGKYQPFTFPSWATKYFCDALIQESKVLKKIHKKPVNNY
jgi:hypothetical protein